MHPYDDIIDFFVEAMLEQIDNTIRAERAQQIIDEDNEANKKAAGSPLRTAYFLTINKPQN